MARKTRGFRSKTGKGLWFAAVCHPVAGAMGAEVTRWVTSPRREVVESAFMLLRSMAPEDDESPTAPWAVMGRFDPAAFQAAMAEFEAVSYCVADDCAILWGLSTDSPHSHSPKQAAWSSLLHAVSSAKTRSGLVGF